MKLVKAASKPCVVCGKSLTRRSRSNKVWASRRFCSNACCTATKKKDETKIIKTCEQCRKEFHRKRRPDGSMESTRVWNARRYCCRQCSFKSKRGKLVVKPVSPCHAAARRRYLGDQCEFCQHDKRLCLHHVDGDCENNSKENFQTLCAWCHSFLHQLAKRRKWKQPGRMIHNAAQHPLLRIEVETLRPMPVWTQDEAGTKEVPNG
jgi:hypothetical protein